MLKNKIETKNSGSAMLQMQHATMLHVTNVCYVTVKKKSVRVKIESQFLTLP